MSEQTFCEGCDKPLSSWLMCDREDGAWCDDCFERDTHCGEKHGEGCATVVHSVCPPQTNHKEGA